MRTHTEGFKANIKQLGKQITSKITFTINNVQTILGDEDINKISLSSKSALLKSVMKELQIDVSQDIPLGTILEYQFGLKVGEEYEYINYGNFIVNKVEKQEDTRSWVITCYDKMLYAMTKYEGLYLQYPVTIRDYINALCTNIGLEFKNASDEFCNYDKTVNEDLFVNQNVTYRDVLDQIAEVTASNVCISNDDKLELRYPVSEQPMPTRPSKNIIDTQGFQNGYINTSGSFVSDNKTALLNCIIPVEAGKTYCFSTNANVDNMVISMFDSSDNFLRRQKVSNTNKLTQLMANDVAYVRYAVNYNNSATMTQAIIDSLEIMGEEGDTRTVPYEPFGPVVMGKNILNVPSELSLSVLDDELIVPLNIEEDGEYTVSIESKTGNQSVYFDFVDENDEIIASDYLKSTRKARTIQLTTNVVNVYISPENGSCVLTNTMLEKGNVRTSPYEPYIEPPVGLDTIDEEYLKDINVKFGEKFGPVNSIVLSRAADSDRIYSSDEESIALNGLTEIKISENQFMNFNDRDQYLPDLLNQLDGLEFYINDYSSTGLMYYELGDLYNVKIGDNTYKTLMLSDCIEISGGLQEDIYLERPDKSETEYNKSDKTDNRINQTYLIVNKQSGEIQALTNRVEVVENSTVDTYTKEQINELVQTAVDGVTNKFTTKGGNNLLRNTGLWFENDDRDDAVNNPYEFWTGKVERISEDKAVNMNALLLKNDTLSQQVEVRNDIYTLSFKYKKLITLADCKLIVNDIEIPLTEEDDEEVVQQIEVSSRNIEVDFITDTDDSCEIYDLMLNIGDSKSEYSQNENETTTDTVNIGKGITITSTDTETVFKANSDGIRIYDDKDLENARTNFTAKGTETDYIEVRNEANIIGLYHKKVGNHIWVTKL